MKMTFGLLNTQKEQGETVGNRLPPTHGRAAPSGDIFCRDQDRDSWLVSSGSEAFLLPKRFLPENPKIHFSAIAVTQTTIRAS